MKKITLFFIFCVNFMFSQTFSDHIIDGVTADPLSVKVVDLDNDGDLDIVAAFYNEPTTTNTGKLIWYENDGNQNYTSHVIDSAINGAIYLFVVDANNDGNMDLLVNAYDQSAIYLYVNNGTNPVTFLTRLTIDASANGSNYSAAEDLDADGILDAIGANYGGGELAWYKWDGGVGIIKNVIDSAVPLVSSVETGDLDGDLDMDLVVAAGSELFWYENDGTGIFIKHTIPSSVGFNGAISAYFIDFDGDSDLDILGSASSSDEVAWFENDGTQNFTKHVIGTLIDYASYGQAADMDNDGDLDVVVSATNTNELFWYENDGTNLIFIQHIAASQAAVGDSYAFDLADIDADGDMDIALTSPGPNALRWLENDFISIPENDLTENAIPLSCGDLIIGDTTDAANEVHEGDCVEVLDDSKDVWFTYTGSGVAEDVTLTTCSPNSLYDTAIAVYTGTIGSLSCYMDNDDDGTCNDDLLSTLTFYSNGTSTYYIKVQGYDSSEFGQFELSVTCAVSGVEEVELNSFNMYPNPASDSVYLSAVEKIQSIEIFNTLGQLVKSIYPNEIQVQVNVIDLSKGTYFIKAQIANKTSTKKLILK